MNLFRTPDSTQIHSILLHVNNFFSLMQLCFHHTFNCFYVHHRFISPSNIFALRVFLKRLRLYFIYNTDTTCLIK